MMNVERRAEIEVEDARQAVNCARYAFEMADRRAAAAIRTRDALRGALAAANDSEMFAGKVYGMIADTLREMGEGESVDRWVETGEFED